jgi:hypothetical protein
MAIVWLEGLGQLKNPVTSYGIELATFRLVTYYLNQLRYRVPPPNLQYVPQVMNRGPQLFRYFNDVAPQNSVSSPYCGGTGPYGHLPRRLA